MIFGTPENTPIFLRVYVDMNLYICVYIDECGRKKRDFYDI